MMKASIKIILLVIFVVNIVICNAQQDSIKFKVIDYLIEKGQLNEINNKKDYIHNIFIVNLIQKKKGEYNAEDYLFKIGTHSSHSFYYLMLKNGEKYEFIDVNDLDEALIHFINVSRENNQPSEDILLGIEAIIKQVYQKNSNAIPWKVTK